MSRPGFLGVEIATQVRGRELSDERFDRFVKQEVAAYVEWGRLPAGDVAPGILHLADDVLAGREPTLRAGDYIAIQNHLRRARR